MDTSQEKINLIIKLFILKGALNSMRKVISAILSSILVFSLIAGTASAATFTLTSDTSVQLAELKAFNDLKAMFTADTVDLAAIKAKYEETMQAKVAAINPEIDTKITFTLKAAIDGTLSAGQAKQAIDKGLQWYFYSQITVLTKEKAKAALVAGDKATAKIALEQAIELYQGSLQGTAQKRDDYYKDLGVMTQDALDTIAIPGMLAAVESGDVLAYNVSRQIFDKTIIKVFALAAMKYAVSASAADAAKAKIEMTEGYFFYMPIFNSLNGGSATDAKFIADAFASGDVNKLNSDEINDAFAAAFNGKISGYFNKTIDVDMAKGNLNAAIEHAMEGNMFLEAEEVLIKKKLGTEAYVAVKAEATQYYNAVKANDVTAAKLHSFNILKVITQLNGVHTQVDSNVLTVNGTATTADAKSYINASTSRTLVPVRFITQAVGADIAWDGNTKTVTITHDGVEIKIVLGQTTIVKDGVVLEYQLDQPVTIKDNYSFVPVRAITEILGYKVFYQAGEIIIVR
jgi:hypothetical protein